MGFKGDADKWPEEIDLVVLWLGLIVDNTYVSPFKDVILWRKLASCGELGNMPFSGRLPALPICLLAAATCIVCCSSPCPQAEPDAQFSLNNSCHNLSTNEEPNTFIKR